MANIAKSLLVPGETREVTLSDIAYRKNADGIVTSIALKMKDNEGNELEQAFNVQAPGVFARFFIGIASQLTKEEAANLNFFATATTNTSGTAYWKVSADEKALNKQIIGTKFTIYGTRNNKGYLNIDSVLKLVEQDEDDE